MNARRRAALTSIMLVATALSNGCCTHPAVGRVVRLSSSIAALESGTSHDLPTVDGQAVAETPEYAVYASGSSYFVVPRLLKPRVVTSSQLSGFAVIGSNPTSLIIGVHLEPDDDLLVDALTVLPSGATVAWYPMPACEVFAIGTAASNALSVDAVWVAGSDIRAGYATAVIQVAGASNMQVLQQLLAGSPGIQLLATIPIRVSTNPGNSILSEVTARCTVSGISVTSQGL